MIKRSVAGSLLIFFLLFSELPGAAATPEFKGSGICQFALHGYVLAPQSEAVINQTVEKLIEQHQAVFGFKRHPGFRLRMRVYGRFEDFTNAPALKGLSRLQGVYVSQSKEILTYQQEIPGFLGATLLHEASHAIMDEYYDTVQPWLLEGAAEYFAYALARNSQNTRLLQTRWATLNAWLRQGKLPTVTEMLNANLDQWKAMDPDIAYAASWSLVQLLMSTEANKRIVKTMLLQWQETPGLNSVEQLDRLYPGGVQALERAWHLWIDKTGSAGMYKAPFRGSGLCRFTTLNYELSPETENAINQQIEALFRRQSNLFGFQKKPGFNLHIRVFGDFDAYVRFTTNTLVSGWDVQSAALANVRGYYSPLLREIVTWSQNSPDRMGRTVLFLASNAILKEQFPKLPQWINSGSPDYFIMLSDPGTDEQKRLAGAWQRGGYEKKNLPPLRPFLDDASRTWAEKDPERRNELVCWALFQFFCSTRENREVLKKMMQKLQESPGSAANSAALFEQLYPGGLKGLESAFGNWVEELKPE